MDNRSTLFIIFISSNPFILNVDNDDKKAPPIQIEYILSGSAITLTLFFIDSGTKYLTSFVNLSGKPENKVVPPDKIIF